MVAGGGLINKEGPETTKGWSMRGARNTKTHESIAYAKWCVQDRGQLRSSVCSVNVGGMTSTGCVAE